MDLSEKVRSQASEMSELKARAPLEERRVLYPETIQRLARESSRFVLLLEGALQNGSHDIASSAFHLGLRKGYADYENDFWIRG